MHDLCTGAPTKCQFERRQAAAGPVVGAVMLDDPPEHQGQFLNKINTHTNPTGIVTLEDALEELMVEEFDDGFDSRVAYAPPASPRVPPETESTTSAIKFTRRLLPSRPMPTSLPLQSSAPAHCLHERCKGRTFSFARKNDALRI
ncbi:hypothetical protein SISNIDRAFT_491883 [Sistotremastrum niveocremeum HHB9708]|uniref:Uncharacterized protein n=1 Tax=Sistotremastrum niveocremeum HHB9708 TaxID=1314777 RepID=A0A164MA65_9AGAM|nr:hypothetical protein SISNIDRAFT_491883 [Sistotremastrum niveocremeum HHB9708]